MPILLEPIIKLFNLVFETSSFPAIWNESLILLIHKKGCKQDPSNYRGISVTSNLGKLFNKIIHNRLINYIKENNLISENQIGFKEKARTSDHIFTLKSLIENHKQKIKKYWQLL